MRGPRNRRAAARAQRLRSEILDMLAQHPPLFTPLSGRQIRARLSIRPLPSERTVRLHMARIHLEAELQALVPG